MKWLITILILATILIAGCTQIQSISIPTQTQQNFTCPYEDMIKESFHEKLYRDHFDTQFATLGIALPDTTLFSNGVTTTTLFLQCAHGSSEGQNVNYLYCGAMASSEPYILEQKITSSEGVIEKVNKYKIKMPIVFDPTNNFTVVELNCQKIS